MGSDAAAEATARALRAAAGEGEHIWFLGALVTIKVAGEAMGGRCSLLEFLIPKGVSPPLHHHPQDETFTLLDGRLTFLAAGERFVSEAGANWIVPRGVPHTFRVDSDTVRLVAVYAPAGIEWCFREAGTPARTATLPPADEPWRPMAEIERAMAAHGHTNVGPPMGPDD